MMLKEIWITRHGVREDKENRNFESPTGLKHDPPLSATGRMQANELRDYLKNQGVERVYSSPLYRALESVYPLVEATKIPLYIDYSMSEWYGKKHEKYLHPAPLEVLQTFFPLIDASHQSSIPLPTIREGVEECHQRVKRGLNILVKQLDEENKVSKVLLVGHGATVVTSVRALIKDRECPVRTGTCSLSKLERDLEGLWKLVSNANCEHLSKGEIMPWTFTSGTPAYFQTL